MAGREHLHHGRDDPHHRRGACHHNDSNRRCVQLLSQEDVLDPMEDFLLQEERLIHDEQIDGVDCVITIPATIPMRQRILPLLYKGQRITRQKSLDLLQTNKGKRKQCNGLVYCPDQMPDEDGGENNGWMTVIRRPVNKDPNPQASFLINVPVPKDADPNTSGQIMVHYFEESECIDDDDRKDFESFLQTHSHVRAAPFESGKMVSAGRRFDYASSSPTTYRGVHMTKSAADCLMKRHSLKVNQIMMNSICKKPLLRELKRHRKFSTGVNVKSKKSGREVTLMPSLAIAQDLTNSLHTDVQDDTQGFAVYFSRDHKQPGLTWFLLPEHGLAIQLKAGTVLSWESSVFPHCSCNCRQGIYGSNPRSNRQVNQKSIAELAYSTHGHAYNLHVGQKVLVRATFGDLEKLGVTWKSSDDCSITARRKKKSYRQATVKAIDRVNKQVRILYEGKLKKLKEHMVPMFHICRLDFLNPTVLEDRWNAKTSRSNKSKSLQARKKFKK